jgi:hypothetical protein
MFNFKESILSSLTVHHIGNQSENEGIKLGKSTISVDDDLRLLLKNYFLKPFKEQGLYTLSHSTDLSLNELYAYTSSIFADPDALYLQSINIAKHLYESSQHPMIKNGELYVVYFDECVIDDEITDAVGIFKSENKDTYLKVYPQNDSYEIAQEEGININKLDKGCLIFNTEKDHGYKVAIIDSTNKGGEEAKFWKEDFISAKPREDNFYHTQNYMQLCKNFAVEAFDEATRVDQIDLVQNSVNYFKEKETFNVKEFEEEVMQAPEVIEKFQDYKTEFAENNQVKLYDEFDVSASAVKQGNKFIKSVIKLDKNFHLYVHGNRKNIERGFDEERQQYYYMLFFENES